MRLDTNLAFFIYPSNRRFGGAHFLHKPLETHETRMFYDALLAAECFNPQF
jgi:hypothetical protein